MIIATSLIDVISEMRNNTGDWFYQGFSELLEEDGFDFDAYHAHYEMNEMVELSLLFRH